MPRPGGNPDIRNYGFKTDRERPLVAKMTLRMDEQMKAAIKSGVLPDWQEIARKALEEALREAGTAA